MMRGTVFIEHLDGRVTRKVLELPHATPDEFKTAVLYKSGTLNPAPLEMTDGAVVSFGPISKPWF